MNRKLKIILFAHPRSGSTTIEKILNLSPEINLMNEPFNESRHEWKTSDNKNYRRDVHTIKDLDKVLIKIGKRHNGFKTLSYQLPRRITKYLLTKKGYQIIFLYRKNFLKSSVSTFIAERTKVWHPEAKTKDIEYKFKPFNLKKLAAHVRVMREDTDYYRKILKQSKKPFFEVSYEEIFEASKKEQMKKLKQMFDFLGVAFPKNKRLQRLLSPKRQMNNGSIYRKIPNVNEIEKKIGNKKNGFLFQKY